MKKALFAAAALLALAACGDDDDGTTVPPDAGADAAPAFVGDPLGSDSTHFRDSQGRAVILRGANARVAGVFDVTLAPLPDGTVRTPLEPIPELTPADCARMAELGWNFLRLPISWSGVEPAPRRRTGSSSCPASRAGAAVCWVRSRASSSTAR